MNILYIDTHLYDINMVLFNENNVINEKAIVGEKHNSVYLISTLKEVIGENPVDQIVVVNGPGSFTGVRLGVTIAKTYAYIKNIPIKSITYFDVLFVNDNFSADVYAVLDGNGAFVCDCQENSLVDNFRYMNNIDYSNYIENKNVVTDVTIDFKKMFKYLENIAIVNPHLVKPIYIKLIGVENDKNVN